MRLVDIDNFINNLKSMMGRDELDKISPHESISIKDLTTLIENEPTAYDVDKVVEKIEKYAHSKMCEEHKGCPYVDNEKMSCENCGAMGTLEIVKSGGID